MGERPVDPVQKMGQVEADMKSKSMMSHAPCLSDKLGRQGIGSLERPPPSNNDHHPSRCGTGVQLRH